MKLAYNAIGFKIKVQQYNKSELWDQVKWLVLLNKGL